MLYNVELHCNDIQRIGIDDIAQFFGHHCGHHSTVGHIRGHIFRRPFRPKGFADFFIDWVGIVSVLSGCILLFKFDRHRCQTVLVGLNSKFFRNDVLGGRGSHSAHADRYIRSDARKSH